MSDEPEPCQCHRNHAAIAPMHHGHCCFWPPTQTCHETEVLAWRREQDRIHGIVRTTGGAS